MKQLIEGKLYDTETATELCHSSESTDYDRTSVTLYRTQKGGFFTHKLTKHVKGRVLQNSINVLPDKEAKEFYAKHGGDVSKWSDVFGEEVELG